jgi:hypothetical protein
VLRSELHQPFQSRLDFGCFELTESFQGQYRVLRSELHQPFQSHLDFGCLELTESFQEQ